MIKFQYQSVPKTPVINIFIIFKFFNIQIKNNNIKIIIKNNIFKYDLKFLRIITNHLSLKQTMMILYSIIYLRQVFKGQIV